MYMRFFSRPASGTTRGRTLSASHEPPGRKGASHISHASPSTIRPTRLPTASQRVAETDIGPEIEGGGWVIVGQGRVRKPRWHDTGHESPATLEGPFALPLGNHVVGIGKALSRGPAGADGEQPHLHHHHRAGALLHAGAGAVHGLSHVRPDAGQGATLVDREPDPGQHRAPGARLPEPVRQQGERPRRRRPGAAAGHGGRPDPHHRQDPQQHLAGAQAETLRPAGADLLGCHHARAADAGIQLEHHGLRVLGIEGLRRLHADEAASRPVRIRLAGGRHRIALSAGAEHARQMGACLVRRIVRRGRDRDRQARARLLHQLGADLFGSVRRFRDGADPAGLDLRRLGHRAARRGGRGLPAEPPGRRRAAGRNAGLAAAAGDGGAAAPRPGPEHHLARARLAAAGRADEGRCAATRAGARGPGRHRLDRTARRGLGQRRPALCAAGESGCHSGPAAARVAADAAQPDPGQVLAQGAAQCAAAPGRAALQIIRRSGREPAAFLGPHPSFHRDHRFDRRAFRSIPRSSRAAAVGGVPVRRMVRRLPRISPAVRAGGERTSGLELRLGRHRGPCRHRGRL
ncbi:hypothetical protein VARIO8X_100076 [Burkholderiales bacterium 8X]|nr:hypothetical protein VARIO8X_100076 [Burkholderiales bacterium 8X]